MSRIIAIANQKGGSAKTSTAINLSAGLARRLPRQNVLLVDIDPQANATAVFLGVPFAAGPRRPGIHTVYEVIGGAVPVRQAIHKAELTPIQRDGPTATLYLLPAHLDLASAELELVNTFERERRLLQALEGVREEFSHIIIDCPPSLGLLTVNALMAATEVVIPVDPGLFPIIGLNLLQNTIRMVRQANPALHISGVTPTLVDRTALARDTLEELSQAFGDMLLPSIPRRVAIGEAHAAGLDIFAYDSRGDGAAAYSALLEEVIRRG